MRRCGDTKSLPPRRGEGIFSSFVGYRIFVFTDHSSLLTPFAGLRDLAPGEVVADFAELEEGVPGAKVHFGRAKLLFRPHANEPFKLFLLQRPVARVEIVAEGGNLLPIDHERRRVGRAFLLFGFENCFH